MILLNFCDTQVRTVNLDNDSVLMTLILTYVAKVMTLSDPRRFWSSLIIFYEISNKKIFA